MELKFTVTTPVNKTPEDVYDAVVKSDRLCQYFTNKTSGDLKADKTITWTWDHYGDADVKIKDIITNELITFEWSPHHKDPVDVALKFIKKEDGFTSLVITEGTYPSTQEGLDQSYDNVSGWQHFALCLKAYIEHGIDLR
ncbi:MAG: hypothetical protein HOH19_04570 [Kordiimonadaceae bacterium]|jgi:uncharacterized protein YndB with AHSA1/START domain|nr:hypothetical protein [Kordiimonadaceae bacterium]MBT6031826.1 hypothetical protein [Kordiimonadaceae bacterium]